MFGHVRSMEGKEGQLRGVAYLDSYQLAMRY